MWVKLKKAIENAILDGEVKTTVSREFNKTRFEIYLVLFLDFDSCFSYFCSSFIYPFRKIIFVTLFDFCIIQAIKKQHNSIIFINQSSLFKSLIINGFISLEITLINFFYILNNYLHFYYGLIRFKFSQN